MFRLEQIKTDKAQSRIHKEWIDPIAPLIALH